MPFLRIDNSLKTTKAQLVQLNSSLARDNEILRNQTQDQAQLIEELRDALAKSTAKNMLTRAFGKDVADQIERSTLQTRSQNIARVMKCSTRIRDGRIEVYAHGGWNGIDTMAIPTEAHA